MTRRIVRRIGESSLAVRMAVKAKRMADRIIRHHMQHNFDDAETNGEFWVLSKFAPLCKTFADVGGNRGDFTAAFLRYSPTAAGTIFEPSQAAYDLIRARFADNPNIRVVRQAVSDTVGTASFFEEDDAGLGSSLTRSLARPDACEQHVELTTLDASLGESCDFVKIDAEGHDLAALRGAGGLLSRKAVKFLQFEYHHTWLRSGATLAAALDFLKDHGYETFLIKGDALFTPSYERYGEYFGYSNYFAAGPDHLKAVRPLVAGVI